jgi:hypothetical protein
MKELGFEKEMRSIGGREEFRRMLRDAASRRNAFVNKERYPEKGIKGMLMVLRGRQAKR